MLKQESNRIAYVAQMFACFKMFKVVILSKLFQEFTELVTGDETHPGILYDLSGNHLSVDVFADKIAELPVEVKHEPVPASLPLEDQNPNGETSFQQAVTKAATIMDHILMTIPAFI